MTFPRVMFVDAPEPDATIRFDFNTDFGDAVCSVNADGFSLGAPSLQGDPSAAGVTFGTRTISLTARITGPKTAAQTVLAQMSRELLRSSNWLLWQLDEFSDPAWFYCYKSPPQPLSLDEVDVEENQPDAWQVGVTLLADPMALQERVTLGPYTVTQTPDGDYPMQVVLPAIEGDAPAPLRVEIAPATDAGVRSRWLLACIAGSGLESPVIDIGSGDIFTAYGGATSEGIADSEYFGGSYRDNDLLASGVDGGGIIMGDLGGFPPGRYRMLLRYDADGTAGPLTYAFRVHQLDVDAVLYVVGDTVTEEVGTPVVPFSGIAEASTDGTGWVNLGEFTFPFGVRAPTDVSGTTPPDTQIRLNIACFDAPTHIRIDALKLIPVDGPTIDTASIMEARFGGTTLTTGSVGTFDSDTESYWSVTDLGTQRNGTPSVVGGFVQADPAAEENLLIVMATFSGDSLGVGPHITDLGAAAEVTVSYHPRKLHP